MSNRPRKTIEVYVLLNKVNATLRFLNDDDSPAARTKREALAFLLSDVLMSTGNYKGFRHTDGANGDADPSKRQYYVSSTLRGAA